MTAIIWKTGEMAEWSMAVVLKTTEPERVPGVRIPLSPPAFVASGDFGWAAAYAGSRDAHPRFSQGCPDEVA